MQSVAWIGLSLIAVVSLSACGKRNVAQFGGASASLPPTSASNGILLITRAEVADQGSGTTEQALPSPGNRAQRATVGGYYLRRFQVSSPNNKLNAGIHGNPTATR